MVERNPQQTRKRILEAAFDEMYEHGYQGMRLDKVLESTELTKGALYHHFPNKLSLAHAVIDELSGGYIQEKWVDRMSMHEDPIDGLKETFKLSIAEHPEVATKGCPLNNLAQEMSGIDEGFNERLQKIYGLWATSIAVTLKLGQDKGQIRTDLNPHTVAVFLISAYQGMVGTAKCMQSMEVLEQLVSVFCDYLENLRA